MGTPLKLLSISPKIIAPLSPIINRNVAKKLDFSGSKRNLHIDTSVKINIIGCDNNNCHINTHRLLVNTPNKLHILKNGLNFEKELNVLGRGTFGTVVRGIYKGEDVAVKVVKAKAKLKEINALKLSHQNVIKIRDVIMKNESHSIIIMEYLDNSKQLQTILDDENIEFGFEEILRVAGDISKGLKYCHDNNVMHLDLKPGNVLVCGDGVCKICDFGNSCAVDNCENYIHEGTVLYTAPEILLGNSPTCACDVFSLGIIFWQLRYRENPYANLESKDIIIYKVVKYGLRPSYVEKLEVDDSYSKLYKSCWAVDPGTRPKISSVIQSLNSL